MNQNQKQEPKASKINKDQDLFYIPTQPNIKISHREILAIVSIMHFFERNPGCTEMKNDLAALKTLLNRLQDEGF